jgi:hypothetical protein
MATKQRAGPIPVANLEAYDRLIATVPGVERKGATMPYTSCNGHMFSFLAKDGSLGLRLAGPTREAFLAAHDATLCEANGTVLKEYVRVPDALLLDTAALASAFAASFAPSPRSSQSPRNAAHERGRPSLRASDRPLEWRHG